MDRPAHPTSWEYGHTTSTPDETTSVCDISPCSPSTIGRSPSSPPPLPTTTAMQSPTHLSNNIRSRRCGFETRLADSPIPEPHVLDVAKARLDPPTFPIISDQRAGPDRGLTRHQAPRLFHLPIVHAHHPPHLQVVLVGDLRATQCPRPTSLPYPLRGLAPLTLRTRHVDITPNTDHIRKSPTPALSS